MEAATELVLTKIKPKKTTRLVQRYFIAADSTDKNTTGNGNSAHKDGRDIKQQSRHLARQRKINKIRNKSLVKTDYYQDAGGTEHKQLVYSVDVRAARQAQHFQMKNKDANKRPGKFHTAPYRETRDPFPGGKPVPKEKIKKYERGKGITDGITRSRLATAKLWKRERKLQLAARQAARTELLMQETHGVLEAENEDISTITQHDIADMVDITSKEKFFELKLADFGPYRINYTRNGRFLLLGGAKGHIAAIDWMTKRLLCEINVMEIIHDVRWLHQETMYAVAQKQCTYIYDNQGIELHCLKTLDSVLRLEFLPYHFLLASANTKGYLSYIDVSVGEKVAGYNTGMGRLDVMCHNPDNAVVHLGHAGGTVTMWCPTVKEPVAKMLCHNSGVRSIAIDKVGQYMATSGIDRTLKIWDLRTYKQLQSYKIPMGAGHMSFSQRGLLATAMGNIVQVYQDCCRQTVSTPYLVHRLTSTVNTTQFCPYEDVLGIGHGGGFTSMLVPGAGEPNFDALESNPYQTKKQRREAEVKMLLEKIPAEMIHLDSNIIGQVDHKEFEHKAEEHNKIKYLKPMKTDFEPKFKMKGRSKATRLVNRKKGVVEEEKREHIKQTLKLKQEEASKSENKKTPTVGSGSVLDRFKRKVE